MSDEEFSRRVNAFFYGDPAEMFCARIWRRRLWWWPMILFVDMRFRQLYGEDRGHCRRVHQREALARVEAVDERFRRLDGA